MSDTPSSQSPENNPEPTNPPLPNAGYTPPPTAISTNNDEKNLAMISHALGFCGLIFPLGGNILGPLILWLLKKDTSPAVNYHAKEALNFQITVTLAMVVSSLLIFLFIGILLMMIVGVAALVLTIIAIVRASEGVQYRYPFTLRLIS